MSIENWGLLTKSQTDPETIEDAIRRIVAEHEADPNAHLGAGESLETHRTFDILDHPQGSVLADKYTSRELVWTDNFTNENVWYNYGPYIYWKGGGVDLNQEGSAVASEVYGSPLEGNFSLYYDQDFLAQYILSLGRDGNTSRFIVGIINSIAHAVGSQPTSGFYFECINNSIRGVAKLPSGTQYTDSVAPPNWQFMVMRIAYNSTEKTVSFYIDGTLLGTISVSAFTSGFQYANYLRAETTDMANLYVLQALSVSFTTTFND
jgi:hypothetical protein